VVSVFREYDYPISLEAGKVRRVPVFSLSSEFDEGEVPNRATR
jgi:hypothetical protein